MQINHDVPLNKKDALANDKLDRAEFSRSVVKVLSKVNKDCGLVISIEGKWGSGKTSTLAMVEELLEKENEKRKPIVVHFNPWLVGDRDALLGQFLSRIAQVTNLTDRTKEGKNVAKAIEAYSSAFDIVKLIPGAEPWASMAKAVFTSVGITSGAIATYKSPNLAEKKQKVVEALVKLEQRMIVFIDDMDRLFPNEVFEMIRIIKAVGELPNIGYVLAWDAAYIEEALKKGEVAYSTSYLDKIVQVRLNLPILSRSAREKLFNEAYETLPDEAKKSYFQNDEYLLPLLYQSGLNKLLDQPRDISRLFNLVQIMEPQLRGNVVLADIIGLSAIALFAPPVYDLLKSKMELFTKNIGSFKSILQNDQDSILKERQQTHELTIQLCNKPNIIKSLLEFLLPESINYKQTESIKPSPETTGRISSKNRLHVALQWGTSSTEIDLNKVRDFVLSNDERWNIVTTLTKENCIDFLEALEKLNLFDDNFNTIEKKPLIIQIAQLLDKEPFLTYEKTANFFSEKAVIFIWRIISSIITKIGSEPTNVITKLIIDNKDTLSFSGYLLAPHWIDNPPPFIHALMIEDNDRAALCEKFAENVIEKLKTDNFWSLVFPGGTLQTATQATPNLTSQIFQEILRIDPSLDQFVVAFFRNGATTKGESTNRYYVYDLSSNNQVVDVSKYCPLHELKTRAKKRLLDPTLTEPALGAWKAIDTGKRRFGNGMEVD